MLGRFPAIFQYALIILHVGELPKFLGSGLLKYTHTDGSDSLFPWAVIYWCLKCKVSVSKWRMLILVVFSLNGAQVCEPGPIPLGAAEAAGFGRLWRGLGTAVQGEKHWDVIQNFSKGLKLLTPCKSGKCILRTGFSSSVSYHEGRSSDTKFPAVAGLICLLSYPEPKSLFVLSQSLQIQQHVVALFEQLQTVSHKIQE